MAMASLIDATIVRASQTPSSPTLIEMGSATSAIIALMWPIWIKPTSIRMMWVMPANFGWTPTAMASATHSIIVLKSIILIRLTATKTKSEMFVTTAMTSPTAIKPIRTATESVMNVNCPPIRRPIRTAMES